jgi:predicted nucleic acid-binding protein
LTAVVSDTSPIRALHHLERLDLLKSLFQKVYIPPGVAAELESPKAALPPLKGAYLKFVEVRAPLDQEQVDEFLRTLDQGESEALALAMEIGAAAILVDERAARQEAKRVGLIPVGLLGILIRAKEKGLVERIEPYMNRLQNEINFFISDDVRREALSQAGEASGR